MTPINQCFKSRRIKTECWWAMCNSSPLCGFLGDFADLIWAPKSFRSHPQGLRAVPAGTVGLSPGRPSLRLASRLASAARLLAVHLLKSQRPGQARGQALWPCGCKVASVSDGGGKENWLPQLHTPAKDEAEERPFCVSHSVSVPVPWHPGPFACARNVLTRQRYSFPGSQTLRSDASICEFHSCSHCPQCFWSPRK